MIDKLENVKCEEIYTDEYGDVKQSSSIIRPPNNKEIIQKINEIIEYININEVTELTFSGFPKIKWEKIEEYFKKGTNTHIPRID